MKTFIAIVAFASGFLGSVALAQDIPTIRVGFDPPGEEAKYWMLRRPEHFPQLGKTYKISWSQFQGTSVMTQALIAGALDCATQGILPLARAAASGALSAYILAQHVGEKPGSFSVYWAVRDNSPIKSIADLKGRTLGINIIGSGTQGPLNMLLKKNGIDPDRDIKLVEVSFALSEEAIRSGRVDTANMNQPFAARAETRGGLRKLFALEDILPNMVHIVEACRGDFVEKNPDVVKMYVRDLTKALKLALADRAETLKVVSEITKVPVTVLDTYLLKPNDFAREPGAAPSFTGIQAMFDVYAETGMINKKLDVERFRHPTIVAPLE